MSPTATTIYTIYSALERGPMSVMQLRELTGKGDNYVRSCLLTLSDEGKVRRGEKTRARRMGPPTYLWERVS
ncbi:hypothetical protein ACQKIE_00070 [Luteibacter sp. NPDC031894]|uniref:hypothetical protein n=1 Tax=Luteibacter sp. NPDC031894 TaxID=3390572 RepID=UPI003D083E72